MKKQIKFQLLIAFLINSHVYAQILVVDMGPNVSESCAGCCDASLSVTVSGGNPPYYYSWNNGANTPTITGLCAGTYSLTVTDSNGSTATDVVLVSQPNISHYNPVRVNVECNSFICGTPFVPANFYTEFVEYTVTNLSDFANSGVLIINLLNRQFGSVTYSIPPASIDNFTPPAPYEPGIYPLWNYSFGDFERGNQFKVQLSYHLNGNLLNNTYGSDILLHPAWALPSHQSPPINWAMGTEFFDLCTTGYGVGLGGACPGSLDPNNKQVRPENRYFPTDTTLKYTIHFQNVGTAEANYVEISDTLDDNLDLSSFEFLSSSHPFSSNLEHYGSKNVFHFTFYPITLPDSATDFMGSQGYLMYQMKPNPDLPIGSVINNAASIIFDFNAPIITNVATDTFTVCNSGNTITPVVDIVATDTLICSGDPVTFVGVDANDSLSRIMPPICQWQKNGTDIPNATFPFYTTSDLADNDQIRVVMTPIATCSATVTSSSITITVNQRPETPVITQTGSTLNSSSVNGNQWYLDSYALSGVTTQSYSPIQSGSYYVVVTDVNECSSDTSNHINFTTGINEFNNQNLSLFPNPTTGYITIAGLTEKATATIMDATGRIVLAAEVINNKVDVSSLANGVYVLRVETAKGLSNYRIIKQ